MRVTWIRTLGVVCALLFVFGVAAPALAQEAAKPALTFDADAGVMLLYVKAERAADFEEMMGRLKEAMGKIEDPQVQKQAAGFKVFKAPNGPAPAGAMLYIMIADPAVKNVEYAFLPILYKAFPAEAKAFSDKWTEIKHTQSAVIWKDLQLVVQMR